MKYLLLIASPTQLKTKCCDTCDVFLCHVLSFQLLDDALALCYISLLPPPLHSSLYRTDQR